jgi:hypothetical protein
MPFIDLEQAIYGSQGGRGYRFLGRSPGFQDQWLTLAERLCMGFGERPAGIACPAAVFAQPLDKQHVAVVQVADQGSDDAGRPGALAFRLLVVPARAYLYLGGDPFAIAALFPPSWQAREGLPTLSLPTEPLPARTVAQVQEVLQRPDSPTLLGGAQALVDGGRIVFPRATPDEGIIRGLWQLLPTSTRARLWPASFAFSNRLGFHALATPQVTDDYADFVHEEQAGDYPEGRYELGVQMAAEAGDQAELDALFRRPSRHETWRLALFLLAVSVLLTVGLNLFGPVPAPPPAASLEGSVTIPGLPPAEQCHTPDPNERTRVIEQLRQLAGRLNVQPAATAEGTLEALDRHLGTPDRARDPGPLRNYGPVQRQLRVLLWKHHVEDYPQLGLNTVELVERLERKLCPEVPGH